MQQLSHMALSDVLYFISATADDEKGAATATEVTPTVPAAFGVASAPVLTAKLKAENMVVGSAGLSLAFSSGNFVGKKINKK